MILRVYLDKENAIVIDNHICVDLISYLRKDFQRGKAMPF